jgi:lipopolysaccharide export system protein LptC
MFVTIGLGALALASWWYARQPATVPRAAATERGQPLGYYMRGAKILGTDEQGRVAYRISADQLEELPGEERLRLDGVHVEYTPVDTQPWSISAAAASAPKDGSELALTGDVTLRSQPTDGREPTVITTESLRFFPDTSSAEADTPVTLKVGGWQLHAGSLRTHLKGDVMRLESDVHGQFAP